MFLTSKNAILHNFIVFLLGISMIFAPVAKALEITVSGNGSGSDSEVNLQTTSSTNVEQVNNSNIDNNVESNSNTGQNNTSDNVGNTQIDTGSINTDIAIENSVNYSSVNTNCCPEDISTSINNNGSDSQNTVNIENSNASTTSINQTAYLNNEINGESNTGENTANGNIGGVSIITGNIQVLGGITNGALNVSSVNTSTGAFGFDARIFDNGSGSINLIKLFTENTTNVFANSYSNIENLVSWDLNTGGNSANDNVGNVAIKTGDIFFDFFINNIVNIGDVDVSCCRLLPPLDPGDDEDDPGEGGEEEAPSEEEENEDEEGSPSGVLLAEAASTQAGPQIVGLSDTSSEAAQALFFWMSIIMIALGMKFVGESLTSKKLAKRKLSS